MNKTVIAILGALVLGATTAGVAGFSSADVPQASDQTQAAVQSQTYTIENMTCATCPITVKKAMQRVDGVKSVSVDFESKTATASFDPEITDISAIAAASTNAGFPAQPQNNGAGY